jgi:hypothetical protein
MTAHTPTNPNKSLDALDSRFVVNIDQARPATAMMVANPADMPRNESSGATSIHSSSE